MRSLQDERLGLQKICVIRVIRGKKLTHSQLTYPLPSSLRQAQDNNNGIKCFLELYKLKNHSLTTHILSILLIRVQKNNLST